MDIYEKKYKEALNKARQLCAYPTTKPFINDLQDIFPELKENEDEQHRKWILEYLYDGLRKSDEQFKDHFRAAIAWLEKQGKSDKIVEKAKTEKQRVLITESDGSANIDWDTRSLKDAITLLKHGLNYLQEIEVKKQIMPNSRFGGCSECIPTRFDKAR